MPCLTHFPQVFKYQMCIYIYTYEAFLYSGFSYLKMLCTEYVVLSPIVAPIAIITFILQFDLVNWPPITFPIILNFLFI